MRVLVTGGLGFQGSHLTRKLLDEGHEATVLNSLSEESLKNSREFLLDARIVWGSVTDNELVKKTVREHDFVFHLAANIHVDESILDPLSYIETNVKGTFNVLEACRLEKTPLVHVSSCEVYGGSGVNLTEEFPFRPRSPYAASKASADSLCYAYSVTYDLPIVILRPANVFGPRQRSGNRGALIPRFTSMALDDYPLLIYGSGSQSRSYIYIEDLVRAYIHVFEHFHEYVCPQVFNVSGGEDVSVNTVVELLGKCLGKRLEVEHAASRAGEVESFNLDSSKFNSTGFAVVNTFVGGLAKYVEWRSLSRFCIGN